MPVKLISHENVKTIKETDSVLSVPIGWTISWPSVFWSEPPLAAETRESAYKG